MRIGHRCSLLAKPRRGSVVRLRSNRCIVFPLGERPNLFWWKEFKATMNTCDCTTDGGRANWLVEMVNTHYLSSMGDCATERYAVGPVRFCYDVCRGNAVLKLSVTWSDGMVWDLHSQGESYAQTTSHIVVSFPLELRERKSVRSRNVKNSSEAC